ncbi:protein of unknown function [Candidatus Nitrospira inopinata]|uniref:Uncharacterized protein n=1 Tax=Candidatus Nitrospira inopinata TaxID=1715989 RepID=A0A0S4KQT0_9BACT|nr:protein of unknown function [Candidatus Nitrospira inopinata]
MAGTVRHSICIVYAYGRQVGKGRKSPLLSLDIEGILHTKSIEALGSFASRGKLGRGNLGQWL